MSTRLYAGAKGDSEEDTATLRIRLPKIIPRIWSAIRFDPKNIYGSNENLDSSAEFWFFLAPPPPWWGGEGRGWKLHNFRPNSYYWNSNISCAACFVTSHFHSVLSSDVMSCLLTGLCWGTSMPSGGYPCCWRPCCASRVPTSCNWQPYDASGRHLSGVWCLWDLWHRYFSVRDTYCMALSFSVSVLIYCTMPCACVISLLSWCILWLLLCWVFCVHVMFSSCCFCF